MPKQGQLHATEGFECATAAPLLLAAPFGKALLNNVLICHHVQLSKRSDCRVLCQYSPLAKLYRGHGISRQAHNKSKSTTHLSNDVRRRDGHVPVHSLGCRSYDVGRQPLVLAHAIRQRVAAVLAGALLVVCPQGRLRAACRCCCGQCGPLWSQLLRPRSRSQCAAEI